MAAERLEQPHDLETLYGSSPSSTGSSARTAEIVDFERYVELNERFHDLLAELAHSLVLREALERAAAPPFASPSAFVRVQAELPESHDILHEAQAQHHGILEAVEARDGARAEALARDHATLRATTCTSRWRPRRPCGPCPGLADPPAGAAVHASGGHFGPARVRAARPVAYGVRLLEIEPRAARGLPDRRPPRRRGHGRGPAGRALLLARRRRPVRRRLPDRRQAPPDSRGGSAFMHALAEGGAIEVSAPQSHFEVHYGRPEYLLVAGGIGITPMVGMAPRCSAMGGPSASSTPAARRPSCRSPRSSASSSGRMELSPPAGRAARPGRRDRPLDPEADLYVCGPLRLMDAARAAWAEQGRPAARLRFETFGSGGRCRPSRSPARADDRSEVHVPPTGRCSPPCARRASRSCGTACAASAACASSPSLEADGRLDHRDVFLSEDEQAHGTKLCACVSRAVGGDDHDRHRLPSVADDDPPRATFPRPVRPRGLGLRDRLLAHVRAHPPRAGSRRAQGGPALRHRLHGRTRATTTSRVRRRSGRATPRWCSARRFGPPG